MSSEPSERRHRKIKWEGHKTEDSILQGRPDSPRGSEGTYLRSRAPLASQLHQSRGGVQPSSAGRAGGCLLNSPARRCRPAPDLPSADADPQQHVLRGRPLGRQSIEVVPGRWGPWLSAVGLASPRRVAGVQPPLCPGCSLSLAHSSAELSRVGNLGIPGMGDPRGWKGS